MVLLVAAEVYSAAGRVLFWCVFEGAEMVGIVSIDWTFIGGVLLVLLGGGGTLVGVVPYVLKQIAASQSAPVATVPDPVHPTTVAVPKSEAVRGADLQAPPGAIEWVADIVKSMSAAQPGTILDALKLGESRDQARTRRIAELEELATRETTEKAGDV